MIGQLSLLKYTKDGKKIRLNIINEASIKWKEITEQLAPKDANLVGLLTGHHQKYEDRLRTVLVENFLNNKPDNYTNDWDGLIELLEDVYLNELADKVREAVPLALSK